MKRLERVSTIALALAMSVLFGCVDQSLSAGSQTEWVNSLKPKGKAGAELTLAANGKTDYHIVLPKKPTTQEQKAAEDLGTWLKEMTGAEFPVVQEGRDLDVPKKFVSIGRTNLLSQARLKESGLDLGSEGYAIAQRGEGLYLIGGKSRGPINAVYALLEEDLGCRWYTSAVSLTAGNVKRIQSCPTLRFLPVPRSYVPQLEIRNPHYYEAFEAAWSLWNRTNAHNAQIPEKWGGHVDYALTVHTFNTLVPPSLFEEHSEYFMLDEDGKRIPRQLCLTNPDVLKISIKKVLQVLKGTPNSEIISVSANDGMKRCHCQQCRVLDKSADPGRWCHACFKFYYSAAGSLIHFVNQVAEAVEKEYPEVLVSTLGYMETQRAPVNARCRDNVAVRLCNHSQMLNFPVDFTTSKNKSAKDYREQIINWSKITKHLHVWEYTSNYAQILMPTPNMHVIGPTTRFYVDHGVKGIMFQGNHGYTRCAERAQMRVWVMAKLLWNPSRDIAELQKDFIWGFYGKAAPAIAKYYELLEDLGTGKFGFGMNGDPSEGVPGLDTMPALQAQAFLEKATAIFDRAEKLAEDEAIRGRVQLERVPVMYVKLIRGPKFVAELGEDYSSLIDRFENTLRPQKTGRLGSSGDTLDNKLVEWRGKASMDPEEISK